MKKKYLIMRIFAIILIIYGVLSSIGSILNNIEQKSLIENHIETTATVIKCIGTTHGNGYEKYQIIVSYIDSSGTEHENETYVPYKVIEGHIITLYYDSQNPDNISTVLEVESITTILCINIVFIILGLYLFKKSFANKVDNSQSVNLKKQYLGFIIVFIVFIVCALLILINANTNYDYDDFAKTAIETTGVIDRFHEAGLSSRRLYSNYTIYVNYTTLDGKQYESSTQVDEQPIKGSTITIYYNKENPTEIRTSLEPNSRHTITDNIMSILTILICSFLIIVFIRKYLKCKNESENI